MQIVFEIISSIQNLLAPPHSGKLLPRKIPSWRISTVENSIIKNFSCGKSVSTRKNPPGNYNPAENFSWANPWELLHM